MESAKNKDARRIDNVKPSRNRNAPEEHHKVNEPITTQKLASARLQEINSLQSSIWKAKSAVNTLAFQSLPRGLRRRAASHNVLRLPFRLRAKALQEMAMSAPKPTKIRRRMRKIKIRSLVDKYLKRQGKNKWLETHIWHTKRMKMINLWGYRLAMHPNTKSERTTYRASKHLAIIHDASYFGCIELSGLFSDIVAIANTITDASLPSVGSARYSKGQRIGHTNVYEYLGYPSKHVCPATFLWKPSSTECEGSVLWIWIHPASFNETFSFLKEAVDACRMTSMQEVQVVDRRKELLRFDLSGPRSTALLQSILDPVDDSDFTEAVNESVQQRNGRLWRKMASLRSSSSLSPGCVLGLAVKDPRIKFPQKVPLRTKHITPEAKTCVAQVIRQWPLDSAYSDIWDASVRKKLLENKKGDQELNRRREEKKAVGARLDFTSEDSIIPILLIQRGDSMSDGGISTAKQSVDNTEVTEGWTLIIPQGWGTSFWKSFIFAGARACGINNIRSMHFESGHGSFPYDTPGTRAYEYQRQIFKEKAKIIWEQKPPSKRANFEKLGVKYPFEASFEYLIPTSVAESNTPSTVVKTLQMQEIQRPVNWLLQSDRLITLLLSCQTIEEADKHLRYEIERLISNRGLDLPLSLRLDHALLKVRIKYIDSRKPQPNAMIYLLYDEKDYMRYTHKLANKGNACKKNKNNTNTECKMEIDMQSIPFPPNHHIGYLTNGGFSLTTGCGFGVGACTAQGILKALDIDKKQKRKTKMVVLIRNSNATECHPAEMHLLA
ncbi:ribonucleases P/MRP protein subunit POP1-domain-containing protein [Spinellus fusiger]|nr:ribonucleases P/MRP protein subunit POP1-domain-containing protein [Spinellus fusiger]